MPKSSSNYITVFIPAFNGETHLEATINAILDQQLPDGFELEVLVIDSGSTDSTLDIIRSFGAQITLHQIPNSEFSHGGTRDEAARMAKGEFILLLTQDATPANSRWITSLIEPFYLSEKVGAVFGAQVPRIDAVSTIKREVASTFASLGPRNSIMIHRPNSLVDGEPVNALDTFFSNANSAVRRDLLVGEVPFRHVAYSEDQALAEDMQKSGYLIAYAPQAEVWHSNAYSVKGYFHRKFDEYIGLQESVNQPMPLSLKRLLLGWIRPTWYDVKFMVHDASSSPKRKIKGILEAPLYNIALKLGQYYAGKYIGDHAKRSKYSRLHESAGSKTGKSHS